MCEGVEVAVGVRVWRLQCVLVCVLLCSLGMCVVSHDPTLCCN